MFLLLPRGTSLSPPGAMGGDKPLGDTVAAGPSRGCSREGFASPRSPSLDDFGQSGEKS